MVTTSWLIVAFGERGQRSLGWGVRPVYIQLTVRTFMCRNAACTRRIFTERLPDLVAPAARNTHRLITALRAIGMALGGQDGSASGRPPGALQEMDDPAEVTPRARAPGRL